MIAKITSGGNFRGALDYLMNSKHKEQERAQGREQKPLSGRQKEAERNRPTEAKTREETNRKDNLKRDEPKADERQQKQSQIKEHELHAERGRDLADEYESGQRHRIIGGNTSGQNPRELAREFGLVRELRPDIEKPVHHVSISAGDSDHLSVEQWQEIADTYIEKMGFQNSPHIVIQHRGTERDHIHILTSRIDFNGKVISEWRSKQRAEKVMREVEKRYDLERLPMSRDVMRAAPTRGEQEVFERTGRMSAKVSLQGHVERALREQPTATEFIEKLQRVGVEAIPNLQNTGRMSGISFRQGKELMKGSDLGRGFSWGALQKRGLSYDPERDRPAIEAARQRAEMSREPEQTVAPPALPLERTLGDAMRDAAKSVVQHEINRLNPLYGIQSQVRMIEQAGRGVTSLYTTAKDLLAQQDNVERLHQAAGLEPTGKNALEKMHQSAGLEPVKDTQDVLERLNQAAGVERPDPSIAVQEVERVMENTPGATPSLERAAEQEVAEHPLEQTIEILML